MMDSATLYQALRSDLSITCIVAAALLTPIALLAVRALIRLGRKHDGNLITNTRGTATIEFALTLPILLFVILALAQTTMLMGGNLFVHYAATAAARSAIVQIPQDYPSEPANEYFGSSGSAKYETIRRTAAFAVMPVASGPGGSTTGANTGAFIDGLNYYYSSYGDTPPVWIQNLAADRLAYAMAATEIFVFRPEVTGDGTGVYFQPMEGGTFEPKDPITVRVHHQLNLGVPFANRLYDDGEQPDGIGRYRDIIASATLTNEGITDELPPPPEIPRIP